MTRPAIFASEADLKRVVAATRIVEQRFNEFGLEDTPASAHADPGPVAVVVKLSDPQPAGYPTSGKYYYGKFRVLDGSPIDPTATPPFEDAADVDCLVFEVSGAGLAAGGVYRGSVLGIVDGETYAVVGVSVGALITANVDMTEESLTHRLEFDQDTYIRVDAGATAADPDVVSIDVAGLTTEIAASSLTFTVDVEVPSCITVVLVPTYAATLLGGEKVWTHAVAHVFTKPKTVTMLTGTPVSPPATECVVSGECCDTVWYCVDGTCVEIAATDPPPDGWMAGPFATESACEMGCGAPTCTEVPPESLPATLDYTIDAPGPLAACVDGQSGTMTETVNQWETGIISPAGCGGNNNQFTLYCDGDTWYLGRTTSYGGCPTADTFYPAVSGTVSPFMLTFVVPACVFVDTTADPSETITITITEP